MVNDRMESVSVQGRILFGCGIVLGVCLGFAAGHVTVWTRISPSEDTAQNPFVADASTDVQPSNLVESEHSVIGDGLRASRRSGMPGPFFAEAARRIRTPTEEASWQPQRVRVATDTSPSALVPDALSFSNAAPIDEETQLREQVTRTIIAQELPHSTEQEQEIWFDVLRGMEAADVKGILRMRKHVGGEPASALGMRLVGPDVATPAPPQRIVTDAAADNDRWATALDSLRRIRDMRLHNLANAETIGFIRQVPVTVELSGTDGRVGSSLLRVELDSQHGSPVFTGRMLDVAITGNGFFQVKHNGEVRLTRCGRFDLDEDRQLVLATTALPWRLDPSIKVPDDVTSIEFHPNGEVTGPATGVVEPTMLGTISLVSVDDPAQLESVGDGLYQPSDESGPIRETTAGVLLEGRAILMLTTSDVEAELASLDRVTRLITEMTHGVSTR